MIYALILVAQVPEPDSLDLGLRPPRSDEVQAAERRSRRQLPIIVEVCRAAVRSGNLDRYVKAFADRNGLSSYGRVTLVMNCRIYEQGAKDGTR
jgi:hypothetical protein